MAGELRCVPGFEPAMDGGDSFARESGVHGHGAKASTNARAILGISDSSMGMLLDESVLFLRRYLPDAGQVFNDHEDELPLNLIGRFRGRTPNVRITCGPGWRGPGQAVIHVANLGKVYACAGAVRCMC